jgi:hypothetical protein
MLNFIDGDYKQGILFLWRILVTSLHSTPCMRTQNWGECTVSQHFSLNRTNCDINGSVILFSAYYFEITESTWWRRWWWWLSKAILQGEGTFHMSGVANRHNYWILSFSPHMTENYAFPQPDRIDILASPFTRLQFIRHFLFGGYINVKVSSSKVKSIQQGTQVSWWEQLNYRLGVCRATNEVHVEIKHKEP